MHGEHRWRTEEDTNVTSTQVVPFFFTPFQEANECDRSQTRAAGFSLRGADGLLVLHDGASVGAGLSADRLRAER